MQDWILIPMVLSGVLLIATIGILAVLARRANRSERARFYSRLTDVGVGGGTIVFVLGFILSAPSAVPAIGMTLAWVAFVFWMLMKLDQFAQRRLVKRAG